MPYPRIRSELPLILASIFIASVIWLIAKQADLETDRLSVAVELQNVPPYMIVEAPGSISINVQYPKEQSNQIIEKNFSLPINVRERFDMDPTQWDPPDGIKKVAYQIKPSNIKTKLDPTIQVIGVNPGTINLVAQPRIQILDVIVETTGALSANLKFIGPPKPDPVRIMVTGSTDALARLADTGKQVLTQPIDLAKLQSSGQLLPELDLPPDVILLGRQDKRIAVSIALTERPVRQTLSDVPVSLITYSANLSPRFKPATVDIDLEGPGSLLALITPSDIVFSTPARALNEQAGRIDEIGLLARLCSTVRSDIVQQVKIIGIRPPRISVEFVPVDEQNKGPGEW